MALSFNPPWAGAPFSVPRNLTYKVLQDYAPGDAALFSAPVGPVISSDFNYRWVTNYHDDGVYLRRSDRTAETLIWEADGAVTSISLLFTNTMNPILGLVVDGVSRVIAPGFFDLTIPEAQNPRVVSNVYPAQVTDQMLVFYRKGQGIVYRNILEFFMGTDVEYPVIASVEPDQQLINVGPNKGGRLQLQVRAGVWDAAFIPPVDED